MPVRCRYQATVFQGVWSAICRQTTINTTTKLSVERLHLDQNLIRKLDHDNGAPDGQVLLIRMSFTGSKLRSALFSITNSAKKKLLSSFHLYSQNLGFDPQTQNLGPP